MTLLGFLMLMIPVSIFLGGGHYGITSIVSSFYPSDIRANGTGWCSGVAKIGSVLGPLIGGYLLSTKLPVRMNYALLAICPMVYGLSVPDHRLVERRGKSGIFRRVEPAPAAAE